MNFKYAYMIFHWEKFYFVCYLHMYGSYHKMYESFQSFTTL